MVHGMGKAEGGRERERERESPADSWPSEEPDTGLNTVTPRS